MKCCDCKFHKSGYLCNSCSLTDSEYYHEFYDNPCAFIDDNYIFIRDCPEMGFVKGEKASVE